MSEQNQRSEELFDQLSKNKKKRRHKVVRTVLILIALVAVILAAVVMVLRSRVQARFAAAEADVKTYAVSTGTINTVVSGSGTLAEVDQEILTVPAGVEITEVAAEAGDTVVQGDVLAKVDMATVMTALSDLQEEMEDLDDDISDAKGEEIGSSVTAGIGGRVKRIFAEEDMDVSSCMAEHGALAVLSLDGYMAVDLEAEGLKKGDEVTVVLADGSEEEGSIGAVAGSSVTVLVTDNGPAYGEAVTVLAEDGTELGSGELYIHNPLAVTGYAGTVKNVNVKENAKVYSYTTLFRLKNTSFSANYDALLRSRGELEETLMALLTIYRDGAVLAPFDGMVSSVSYDPDAEETVTAASYSVAAMSSAASSEEGGETELLTLYPNIAMEISIGVDETDILALELDQEAEITVSSVSEEVFAGTVTEISKVAVTTTGVPQYSAVVTLDRAEGMLAGMTAEVDVKIEGVENALIIPLEALHQTSTVSYVYTSYDEETKQYGGMVEVTIGMQNDEYVEILTGLREGDTVYYTETRDFMSFLMGMSGMGGGGMQIPSGGMPSGGMPSGGGMPGGMGGRSGMNRGG